MLSNNFILAVLGGFIDPRSIVGDGSPVSGASRCSFGSRPQETLQTRVETAANNVKIMKQSSKASKNRL